jgi:methylated-DNA-[protein]-cysteine S-methyltransferase
MILFTEIQSPIGRLLLTSDGVALTGVHMETDRYPPRRDATWTHNASAEVLVAAARQLQQYFAGQRHDFDLPLAAAGTTFQQKVWRSLREIPYGVTWSYGALARRIEQPTASRAVGLANGRNPIAIIVPCHRVIGANGTLTGYGGGLPRKQWLLQHERTTLEAAAA